jgi:hypothetical protein
MPIASFRKQQKLVQNPPVILKIIPQVAYDMHNAHTGRFFQHAVKSTTEENQLNVERVSLNRNSESPSMK